MESPDELAACQATIGRLEAEKGEMAAQMEVMKSTIKQLELDNAKLSGVVPEGQGVENQETHASCTETQPNEQDEEEYRKKTNAIFLGFVEDSPFFRKRLFRQERWVNAMEVQFNQLAHKLSVFTHASKAFANASAGLSTLLMRWEVNMEDNPNVDDSTVATTPGEGDSAVSADEAPGSACREEGDPASHNLASAMSRMGEMMSTVGEITGKLTISFEMLGGLIGEFGKTHLQQSKDRKQAMDKAMCDYENCIHKVMSRKQKGPEEAKRKRRISIHLRAKPNQVDKALAEDEELKATHTAFELARFEYVHSLNQIRGLRRLEMVENASSCFYSFYTFFHQGNDTAKAIKRDVDQLHIGIQRQKNVYSQCGQREQEARRLLWQAVASPEPEKQIGLLFPDTLRASSAVSRRGRNVKIEKEGYLRKRSDNVRKDWKRRWFALQDGCLYYYRSYKDLEPHLVVNVLISTVRRTMTKGDLLWTFEIISPRQRVYTLQAESEASLQEWTQVFMNSCESLLETQTSDGTAAADAPSAEDMAATSESWKQIAQLNPTCADCGEKDPSWASINLGVLMCIECSGIHRSLGVHITKVRSTSLDDWDVVLLQLMAALGNDKVNWVYEGVQSQGFIEKPVASSSRQQKDEYIRLKYVQRALLNKEVLLHAGEQMDRLLSMHTAAEDNDLEQLVRVLAMGTDVNWPNPDDGNKTALHKAAENDCLVAVEYLYQNNASAEAKDAQGRTALDLAKEGGSVKVAARLSHKHQQRYHG